MNIRVDLTTPIIDGTEVVFRSPVDCSQVTGLKVYSQGESKEFAFADAHGNNVGDIDHLFAENVVVKVILDVTTGMAFVQNADTNAYLERRFAEGVTHTPQDLTPEQQAQARANIGAAAVGEGGGTTEAIIDVTELPTENINEDAFYRVISAKFVYGEDVLVRWTCICVEELPEVGEDWCWEDEEGLYHHTAYYNLSDGEVYAYLSDSLAEEYELTPGWNPAGYLIEWDMDTFWGVITNMQEAIESGLVCLLIEYSIYHYKDGWFIVNKQGVGNRGTGDMSEVFNSTSNEATGYASHAEGTYTTASGDSSHAEGTSTTASGVSSHAEGTSTTASGIYSHAEGTSTTASGAYSHAEGGSTTASGEYSHAEGRGTQAKGISQHVQGEYNIVDPYANYPHKRGKYAHIVGNGDMRTRSNAHTLDWNGLGWFAGGLKVGGTGQNDPNAEDILTESQVKQTVNQGIYYSTTREEVGKAHEEINAEYIYGLYDALITAYPGNVKKLVWIEDEGVWSTEWEDYKPADGTFVNYAYEISTGEYATEGTYTTPDDDADEYSGDPHIKKPKYLLLGSIHGTERKTAIATYRFIRDVLSGHNVPQSFREGVILSVMPVGTPSAFDAFTRYTDELVDINRNFDCDWMKASGTENGVKYTSGESGASEKETQAIANWLADNTDAELFLDFHNSGSLNEKVVVVGLPDNGVSDIAKKVALRGLDRIIPFWRDVIGYPDTVDMTKEDGVKDVRDVIYSYCASVDVGGASIRYAQKVLGIRSIAIETASHYGNYLDWVRESYSPEAIAMGAEALGNILIEFYDQSCEVIAMSNVDSKLETLLERVNSGFRIEGGIYTQPSTVNATTTVTIPCSNPQKVKAIEFYASEATEADIRANDYTANAYRYVMSAAINTFASGAESIINISGGVVTYGLKGIANIMTNLSTYGVGWDLNASASTITVGENGVSFNAPAIMQGTYNWTAYYWND